MICIKKQEGSRNRKPTSQVRRPLRVITMDLVQIVDQQSVCFPYLSRPRMPKQSTKRVATYEHGITDLTTATSSLVWVPRRCSLVLSGAGALPTIRRVSVDHSKTSSHANHPSNLVYFSFRSRPQILHWGILPARWEGPALVWRSANQVVGIQEVASLVS